MLLWPAASAHLSSCHPSLFGINILGNLSKTETLAKRSWADEERARFAFAGACVTFSSRITRPNKDDSTGAGSQHKPSHAAKDEDCSKVILTPDDNPTTLTESTIDGVLAT